MQTRLLLHLLDHQIHLYLLHLLKLLFIDIIRMKVYILVTLLDDVTLIPPLLHLVPRYTTREHVQVQYFKCRK